MGKEVSEYISKLFAQGIKDWKGVCDHIKKRMEEIDAELHKADALRAEKIKLVGILHQLDDPSVKRKRAIAQAPPIELDDNSTDAAYLRYKICQVIETEGALANRDIIQKAGGYQQEQAIIRSIKFLGENKILSRDSERRHAPGPNWDQRPQSKPNNMDTASQ